MYTCVAVDDQEESLKMIKDHILQTDQLNLTLATTKSVEALNFVTQNKPDIIFLDIEMPGISGIDFIDNMYSKWGTEMPRVVFTTGFNQYALQGYEYGAVDYIMKPITYSRFKKSVDRIVTDLEKQRTHNSSNDFFFADTDGKRVRINFSDIIYAEGARNYTVIVTDARKYAIGKSMRSITKILPETEFLRVHKSYIVSVDKIRAQMGNQLIVDVKGNETSVPIGITYRSGVMKRLRID